MPYAVLNAAPTPDPAPPSAAAWLRASPRGVYTSLVVLGDLIPHWQWHTERLASSLAELATSEPAALPAFAAWHGGGPEAASPLPLASHLSNAALPSLAAAVRGAGRGGGGSGSGGGDVGVVILVTDAAAPSPCPLMEPPLDVRAYAWALPPAPDRARPAAAVVVGPPRSRPAVKDSAWAADRLDLEAALQPGAADGILARPDGGRLVEGLVTNLFVVQRGSTSCGSDPPLPLLLTAAPADGALDGIVRRVVLDLARADGGIAVVEAPPDPAHVGAWTEAFLTNAVRGVQPLTALVGPPPRGGEGGAGVPAWQVGFEPVPGPVTARLMARLGRAMAEHATRLPKA